MQRDVNVPHGKAATETLMLTTVVSLASDDPGPELGTRRGEEERRERELRCYGPGVTRGEERGVRSDGRGGARPGQCQCQDQELGTRERDVTTSYNILTCFQNIDGCEEIL